MTRGTRNMRCQAIWLEKQSRLGGHRLGKLEGEGKAADFASVACDDVFPALSLPCLWRVPTAHSMYQCVRGIQPLSQSRDCIPY